MFKNLLGYQQTAQYFSYSGYNIAYWQVSTPSPTGVRVEPHLLSPSAEPIVFLHGFPSASLDWSKVWNLLSNSQNNDGYGDFHAIDFLGFGLSDKPHPHRYTLQEQADIIVTYLHRQGIRQCHIVAHDYGVSVAQELLARQTLEHNDNFSITSMMFLNGGLFAELHRPILTQKLLHSSLGPWLAKCMSKRSLTKGFNKIFGQSTPPETLVLDELWALLKHAEGTRVIPSLLGYLDERKQYRNRWVRAMQSTPVPLGFINGVQDPISGQHMLDAFTKLLPSAYTKALDVGHYPQLEDPNSVYLALKEFWRMSDTQ
ncbi:alpha/beta fold hydrolase [Opacimonas viscosa]|uniref:Alpha/beta hydrolase n=1 Tax=Opacimonas viscosa TaxID=2961944 RepID=A0AA41X1A8_9ALTE|nr:alpha/beta hydrolase [Opacimonas viscosa]MCP3428042.1 alpha/beta hydrolase [Opacimonas viscosa]